LNRLDHLPPGCTLGLNYTCMHDAAVAIVDPDGAAVFACALERLTRVKQDGRWPELILDQIPFDRIDTIAIGSLDMDETRVGKAAHRLDDWPARRRRDRLDLVPFEYPQSWHDLIASLPGKRTLRFDHHHCHAASAYYLTDFEDALVLTSDSGAFQCDWSFGAYRARGDDLEQIAGMHFLEFITPGHLYTLVTALLGHRPNRHEGKVTGLAARAEVSAEDVARFEAIAWPLVDDLSKLVRWDMCADLPNAPTCVVNEANRLAWREEFRDFSDEQMAACVQHVLEDYMAKLVAHASRVHGEAKNICLAGGVFANVLLNQKIIRGFDSGFVAPPMTDDGVALGAAFLGHLASHPESSPRRHRATMYLGPDLVSDGENIEPRLLAAGLEFEKPVDIAGRVAQFLSEGKIVAVARGRMEFGPRALGHRSILAPATDVAINDSLNRRLQRTEFMPFAPMVHRREAHHLLAEVERISDAARFMTVTADCLPALIEEAPAVVHLDGTARPQIVDPEDEPFCARVLEEYASRTGRRALVNTSFNVHEQPIVCSMEDALIGFAQTGLDFLCIEDWLVPLAGNEAALQGLLDSAGADLRPGNLTPLVALSRWVHAIAAHHEQSAAAARQERDAAAAEVMALVESATAERDAALEAIESLRAELRVMEQRFESVDAARAALSGMHHVKETDLQRIREGIALIESTAWARLGRRLRLIRARAE
jgi:carbamoyltransferase